MKFSTKKVLMPVQINDKTYLLKYSRSSIALVLLFWPIFIEFNAAANGRVILHFSNITIVERVPAPEITHQFPHIKCVSCPTRLPPVNVLVGICTLELAEIWMLHSESTAP